MRHVWIPLMSLGILLSGCAVIHQGEVGLRRVWGRIDPEPLQPGAYAYESISTDILRVPIRTTTKTIELVLPSKEGLSIQARLSVLYRVQPERAADVITNIGVDDEETLIATVFRSQAADVSARFFAKDMHSAERLRMEETIRDGMRELLAERGFVVESVHMKNIALPAGLARAIEDKLESEQQAEQMRFLIERERLEADRKRIEAEGIRDAQRIISEGLTPEVLRLRQIEALRDLARSNNTKIVVTDPATPVVLQTEGK